MITCWLSFTVWQRQKIASDKICKILIIRYSWYLCVFSFSYKTQYHSLIFHNSSLFLLLFFNLFLPCNFCLLFSSFLLQPFSSDVLVLFCLLSLLNNLFLSFSYFSFSSPPILFIFCHFSPSFLLFLFFFLFLFSTFSLFPLLSLLSYFPSLSFFTFSFPFCLLFFLFSSYPFFFMLSFSFFFLCHFFFSFSSFFFSFSPFLS